MAVSTLAQNIMSALAASEIWRH